MESTLSRARVATRNEAQQALLLIRGAVIPQAQSSVPANPHTPRTESTQISAFSQSSKSRKTIKFSELVEVVNEAKTPSTRSHRVKYFYESSRLEESPTWHMHSPDQELTTAPISENSYSSSADISPIPSYEPVTPHRESTSPSPEPARDLTKRVTWLDEEPDSEMQKKKMKDFGKWICLGESGFLKRPIRKTY